MARKWYGSRPYDEFTSSTGGTTTNVSYDATGAGNSVDSGSNSVNITWSHTAAGGANSIVVVALMVGGVAETYSGITRTVTYDGNAMTSLTALDSAVTNGWIEMFYLLNPPGGTKTVSVTVAKGSTSFGRVAANSFSYNNATSIVQRGLGNNNASATFLYQDVNATPATAGCMAIGLSAVDSNATITSFIFNNGFSPEFTVYPDQGGNTRWVSNSGSTTGLTSAGLWDAPPSMTPVVNNTVSSTGNITMILAEIHSPGTPVPTGIDGCWLTMISGGGGGGAGRRGGASTDRFGGTGGGGGGFVAERYIPIEVLGTSYNLFVPPAASGAAAVTVNDTDGGRGSRALDILFGSGDVIVVCGGGHGGSGGGSVAPARTTKGSYTTGHHGYGGTGGSSSVAGTAQSATNILTGAIVATGSGGGGGGISAANTAYNGGTGANNNIFNITGGNPGLVGGATPGNGGPLINMIPGASPGGGAASISVAAQAGASAVGYGAGGGGGGASVNGNNSGAGGNGGPAYVRILWDYR